MSFRLRHFLAARTPLLLWASWFAVANSVLFSGVAIKYFIDAQQTFSTDAQAYLIAATLGHFSLLSYAMFIVVLLPLIILLPLKRLIQPLAVLFAFAGLLLLIGDTLIYNLYKFHLSGFVFDLLINGGGEVFSFSKQTWMLTAVVSLSALLLEVGLALIVWQSCVQRRSIVSGWWVGVILLLALLSSQSIHAWADAAYYRSITSTSRYLPFYYPATAKRFFERHNLVDLQANRNQRSIKQVVTGDLDYPKTAMQCSKPEQPLNLLYIVIDSWRYDMMSSSVTPNIADFSKSESTLSFQQHFSGGNSTRSGIFSLFYGLPSTYWNTISSSQVGAVLIDQLQAQNYQMGIFASAKLTSPAFDRTVFANVKNLKVNTKGDTSWRRDRKITDNWLEFVKNKNSSQPFFGFLFYDSIHGYSLPPDYPRLFQPAWKEVNHLELNNELEPTPYLNLYKTTANYVDSLVKEVLTQLKDRQLLDKTIVVITSDHGEEFNETKMNNWGHGSNFTRYQTQVPLVVHWPGKQHQSIL
ncbi:MAG: DUF3413 domain-containing protein, partial [Chromatiales bacterium]|nr:DUF3413 domain-containing protein [Chromatiales bacterium]